jgi:hypothetical protein
VKRLWAEMELGLERVGVVLRALLDEHLRDENYDPAPQDDGQHGPGTHESDSDPIHRFLPLGGSAEVGRLGASAARIGPVRPAPD